MLSTNGNIDRPLRVALYARVSSDEQKEGDNIRTQVELAEKYVDTFGMHLAGQYLDEAVSGTVPLAEREAGARLLQAAREK